MVECSAGHDATFILPLYEVSSIARLSIDDAGTSLFDPGMV